MATTIRERPILFSGPMVRAILAGHKIQTRRVMKDQPIEVIGSGHAEVVGRYQRWMRMDFVGEALGRMRFWTDMRCPYGIPGDRLWVRETFARRADVDPSSETEKARHYLRYRAGRDDDLSDEWHDYRPGWRPSIHMPRWASRIDLEITSVRVERLQAITEDDATAEGVQASANYSARQHFARLWDEINGKRGHPWVGNPWVWVVEFSRVAP